MSEKTENAKTFEDYVREIRRDLLMERFFGPRKGSKRSDADRDIDERVSNRDSNNPFSTLSDIQE